MHLFEEPKIDCHNHLFDPLHYPYSADTRYRPAGQEIGTLTQFRAVMQAYGVQHALLVGPNSGYGFDNRYLLDAIAQGEGRFKGMAVVPLDVSAARLAELKAQHILGVTFNVALDGVDHYRQADTLFNRLADLDMFAQIQVEKDQLVGMLPLIERTRTRLLVDHSGRPDAAAGLGQPGFQALLRLAYTGRVAVKLSGLYKFSAQVYPFADAMPYQRALLAAYGPEHCLWGSDWPFLRAPERLDYGPLLVLAQSLMPDPAVRHQVFWETPRQLFGFGG